MENLHKTNLLNVEDYESLEEYQENEGIYNNGQYIIEQLYNGNWTDGVNNLKELCVTPVDFADFVEAFEDDLGSTFGFLDRYAFILISQLYYNNN